MRILVIDDDEVDFMLSERLLQRAFQNQKIEISWISRPAEGNILKEIDDHDVCLIDQNMGSISGTDIIRQSCEHGSFTPIILLTGDDSGHIDELAIEIGATDYLVKGDLTPTLLNRSIRFSFAQKENQRKLSEYAYRDGLTGLANRIKFDQVLEIAINTSERSSSYLALFLVDLDDFKIVNDTYGHAAGDAVLKTVANRMSATVRRTYIVGRLGCEDFCILLNGYRNKQDIELLTRKMLSVFEEPIQYDDQNFHCRCSIGIAVLSPKDQNRIASELTRAADGALYKAKNNGKNSFEFYDAHIAEAITTASATENALANAIKKQELELYFQPKVSAKTQEICGCEALLRWHREDAESMGPADFIPIAERSLSIKEIGRWVIEEACRQLRVWIDSGVTIVPVSINVSPIQIQTDTFVGHIKQTLERYKIDPTLIELEITESVLIQQYAHLEKQLRALADIGCKWVIDDFGVGYSSLSRLKDLPVSKIKLDRSFVQHIVTSKSSRKICNVVSLLANELDLVLVAEGVEDKEQFDALTLLAKDEVQGFYFSKPLSSEMFQALVGSVVAQKIH